MFNWRRIVRVKAVREANNISLLERVIQYRLQRAGEANSISLLERRHACWRDESAGKHQFQPDEKQKLTFN